LKFSISNVYRRFDREFSIRHSQSPILCAIHCSAHWRKPRNGYQCVSLGLPHWRKRWHRYSCISILNVDLRHGTLTPSLSMCASPLHSYAAIVQAERAKLVSICQFICRRSRMESPLLHDIRVRMYTWKTWGFPSQFINQPRGLWPH
jgi:hypothetical protein